MPLVVASVVDATPAWITEMLRAASVLPQGTVIAADVLSDDAFNSQIARLALRYSADAPSDAPARLLLKLNAEHDGQAEAGFYQLAARERARLPMLVPCYAASYDPASGASHCLLLDLSATHGPPVSRAQVLTLEGVPSEQHLVGIVDALAAFHAVWWEHSQLGAVVGVTEVSHWYRDAEHFAARVERARGHWAQLVREEGAWLPAEVRERCAWVLARLPRLWERHLAPRVAARRQLTLGDHDGYFNQYLCPRVDVGQTYKVDFQDSSADFGAVALVYLFATFWTPQIRQEGGREARLLHRYHAGLLRGGVKHYSFEQLMDGRLPRDDYDGDLDRGVGPNLWLGYEISHRRIRIEHFIASVKRCRILKDTLRLWKDTARDLVMEVACGIHNGRLRPNPWPSYQ